MPDLDIKNSSVTPEDNSGSGSGGNKKNVKPSKDSKTPVLDQYGKDITEAAKDGNIDPIIGREKEIERVSQILGRRKKNNPILIGDPGCVVSDTEITIRKVSNVNKHSIINK